jgi:hypothetical protein
MKLISMDITAVPRTRVYQVVGVPADLSLECTTLKIKFIFLYP